MTRTHQAADPQVSRLHTGRSALFLAALFLGFVFFSCSGAPVPEEGAEPIDAPDELDALSGEFSAEGGVHHGPASPLTAEEQAALEADLRAFVQTERVPGLVFTVTHKERLLVAGALGHASVQSQAPMDWRRSLIQSGSLTKILVSLAVLKLVDEGALALDTRVSTVLPWFDAERFRDITIEQLLSHRSGLPRHVGGSNTTDWELLKTGVYAPSGEAARGLVLGLERLLPGDVLGKYSNLGFYLLGEVLVHVAKHRGHRFESSTHAEQVATLLEREVLRPLGLRGHMQFMTADSDQRRTVQGYSGLYPADQASDVAYRLSYYPLVDGGAYQAVSGMKSSGLGLARLGLQLTRWARQGNAPQLLDRRAFAQMLKLRTRSYSLSEDTDSQDGYGLGLLYSQLVPDKDAEGAYLARPFIGHTGSALGGRAIVLCEPVKALCISMAISDSLASQTAVGRILYKYFGPKLADEPEALSAEVAAALDASTAELRAKTRLPEAVRAQLPVLSQRATLGNLRAALAEAGESPAQVDSLISAEFYDGKGLGYAWRKKIAVTDEAGTVLPPPYADEATAFLGFQTAAGKPATLYLDRHRVTGQVLLRLGYETFLNYGFETVTWEYEQGEVKAIALSERSLRIERFRGNVGLPIQAFP